MSPHEQVWLTYLPQQVLIVVAVVAVTGYALPKIAEASEHAARLLGPLGRYWRERAVQREAVRRAEIERQAREIAQQIAASAQPPDYAEMSRRLGRMETRLRRLEESEELMRAFIAYDAEWHFSDRLDAVERPECAPAPWLTFVQFRQLWDRGWRPGQPIPAT